MRTHKVRFSTLVMCALLLSARMSLAQSSQASAPRTLSYQGVLIKTGNPGTNATGSRLLTVTLYSDANGNTKLWQSTMNTQVDMTGVFNCTLGTAENPLPAPSTMDRPIWLGVAIDNGPELRPLSKVSASAYALNVVDNAITTNKLVDNAVTTTKLADNAVTMTKIADSSITASKVNMDYISSININGVQFTGQGTPLSIRGDAGIRATYEPDSNMLVLMGQLVMQRQVMPSVVLALSIPQVCVLPTRTHMSGQIPSVVDVAMKRPPPMVTPR